MYWSHEYCSIGVCQTMQIVFTLSVFIGIRNRFIALVFANNECAFVELVPDIEH